jgi:cell division protein FtsQ
VRYAPPGRVAARAPRNVKKTRRNRRKLNFKLLLKLFAVSALISGLAAFAVQTPALVVREVRIEGVRLTERAEVERAAKAALGRNILILRKGPILASVRRLPEVAAVEMGRSFPSGVWVRVFERKPAAVLRDCTACCMMQQDGLLFHKTRGPVDGLPVLQVAGCACIKEGRRCGVRDVANGLEVLRRAKACRLEVSKISVDPLGDICLNMESGFYVKLGQPVDIARQMSDLRTTLICKPSIAREAEYIDVSCPGQPAWKRKA